MRLVSACCSHFEAPILFLVTSLRMFASSLQEDVTSCQFCGGTLCNIQR